MLTDKVILIAGANGGLGVHVTNAFLDAGATVAGVAPKIDAADFPNPRFLPEPAAIDSETAAAALVTRILARAGRIDVLVHLVGGFTGGQTVAATPAETWTRMFRVNLDPFFFLARAVLPAMQHQGGGAILAIGSRTALEPVPTLGAYSASKAALVSLVRTIALEAKSHNITANIVLPGTMDTPANRAAMPQADHTRWVHPSQVAAMLVHLCSPAASQVTGAVIPIYGSEA